MIGPSRAGLGRERFRALENWAKRLLHQLASRKFFAISGPIGVSTDSGWN